MQGRSKVDCSESFSMLDLTKVHDHGQNKQFYETGLCEVFQYAHLLALTESMVTKHMLSNLTAGEY